MLLSMTGFGRSVAETSTGSITIEIRSLNSKNLDVSFRPAHFLGEKEIMFRTEISNRLARGKIDVTITEKKAQTNSYHLNLEAAADYLKQIRDFCSSQGLPESADSLRLALTLPAPAQNEPEGMTEADWQSFATAFQASLQKVQEFRIQEGNELARDILEKIDQIGSLARQIADQAPSRLIKIRERITRNLDEFIRENRFDPNRLEQEMIFYLEKLDLNEELVRLSNHLSYFREVVEREDAQGRKLGFIVQEIGREINTLGSKANDSAIQQWVIQMKDELEKIREQILNAL